LNEKPVDVPGGAPQNIAEPSRARRLFGGWSANFLQMILGFTQQVALIPVFLHFWSSEVLAAWLVLYAVGNLALIADSGLQFRAINRFLAFKTCADCDGRTARVYLAMLRIYQGLAVSLLILLLIGAQLVSPSALLGFQAVANFDSAFVVMTAGMLLSLPSGLVSGLYRARGLYGRAVRLQNWGVLAAQLAQLLAIFATGSLLAVTISYAVMQALTALYFLAIDAPRRFPFLRDARATHSWRWIIGQFRKSVPFAVAGATELALLNMPVLLVSAFVTDRMAVAQWGLTRVIAGLVRQLCVQTTLPLAAELGHDYAMGLNEQLRSLYSRGSVLVAVQASLLVSGLLPFCSDFFALWTHNSIRYDPWLAMTLLIGAALTAPSILALGFATYSNRGYLLVNAKGLQLAVFLLLSVLLIPGLGPLGAAIAVVSSDLTIQFGVLGLVVVTQTLERPFRHVLYLAAVILIVMLPGWALGITIRSWLPGSGIMRFAAECLLWLIVVAVVASPILRKALRTRLIAAIPR
jgi:O-antigen/teichoic acid export membrane protein